MITAYLVGDQQVLQWLDTLPGAINSGLVRSITRLGIGLQRTLQQDNISGRVPTSRTARLMSKSDFVSSKVMGPSLRAYASISIMPFGKAVWPARPMSEPAFGAGEKPSSAPALVR